LPLDTFDLQLSFRVVIYPTSMQILLFLLFVRSAHSLETCRVGE